MSIQKNDRTDITLQEIKANIDNALSDLRNIARNLNGGYLQQLTFLQFLESYKTQIGKNDFIVCETFINGKEQEICLQNKIILFRILQECFQNVIKHAEASFINIEVFFEEAVLQLVFKDNGKGFDTEATKEMPKGLGLQNMKNRIELIHGTLTIRSLPEKGTIITIIIPYET